MKFILIAMMASAAPFVQALETFSQTSAGVRVQMTTLTQSIKQVKQIAQQNGHNHISAKCDEAAGHIQQAQNSFARVSSGYLASPWNARGSTHATEVRYRMSLCANSLSWIFAQPELRKFPQYRKPVVNCQSSYDSCQKGCQKIWTWPTPAPTPQPGYTPQPTYAPAPKPSQAHSGYNRRAHVPSAGQCKHPETACPLKIGSIETECIDLKKEVASCGGCVSKHQGENCLKIVGANGVGCLDGHCVVLSVHKGYTLNKQGRPEKH